MANVANVYTASGTRYDEMRYHRVGRSGLKFPAVSLGLWQNFGSRDSYENSREMCRTAFDLGITQFDLANNYGPVYGSAEETFGKIMEADFRPYRDELVVTSKAGYDMWDGPYGNWGSRKYLMASLDQSLKRMRLDYVDIFYHHRMDPETPLEETMQALADIVRSGKALYAGVSNYDLEYTKRAAELLKELHCPFIVNQEDTRYSTARSRRTASRSTVRKRESELLRLVRWRREFCQTNICMEFHTRAESERDRGIWIRRRSQRRR